MQMLYHEVAVAVTSTAGQERDKGTRKSSHWKLYVSALER